MAQGTATDTGNSTIRLGMVGAGGMGRTHASSVASVGGAARVVAVADGVSDAAGALAAKTESRAFSDAGDMIRTMADELDAVVLCTPPSVRKEVVSLALEHGVAVLIEKPLADTHAHAKELVDLAARHPGLVTACAYCHRFTPAIREMIRLAHDGDLGRIVRWENTFACSIPDMGDKWMSDTSVSGGGSLIDTGCHSLDLFRYMCGDIEPVGAVFDRKWNGRGESGATSLVRSASTGVAGTINNGWLEPARFLVTLVGEEAILSYDYEQPTILTRKSVAGTIKTIEVESHEVRFDRQMAAFIEAVAGAKRDPNLATLADGLAVAQAVDALTKSAR